MHLVELKFKYATVTKNKKTGRYTAWDSEKNPICNSQDLQAVVISAKKKGYTFK